jgi:hypothetical protein
MVTASKFAFSRRRFNLHSPPVAQSERSQNLVSGTGAARPSMGGAREQFSAEELAVVLSNFEIGTVESVVEFPRGSRKAPKLLIVSEQGKFLLKRRARGRDDPFKVAFTHSLQLYLAAKQFPLPHLIGTKKDNNSMLQWRNGVYELFEYIPGQAFPQTLEATFDAGRVLGLFHKLLEDFKSEWQPPSGSYHAAGAVEQGLRSIANNIPATEENASLQQVLTFLSASYRKGAEKVQSMGIDNWPKQIVHADWHPGNMLFRDNHVVAVLDYDSGRESSTSPTGHYNFPSSAAMRTSRSGRNTSTRLVLSDFCAAMTRSCSFRRPKSARFRPS